MIVSTELSIFCTASLLAEFIDSFVVGGGLIQLPAFMLVLPQFPVVSLLATSKLVCMTGTAVLTHRFSRQVPYIKTIIIPAIPSVFLLSRSGIKLLELLIMIVKLKLPCGNLC